MKTPELSNPHDYPEPHSYFFESMELGTICINRLVSPKGVLLDDWGLIVDGERVQQADGLPMAWESAGSLAKRIELRLTGVPQLDCLSWDAARPKSLSRWQTSAPDKTNH